MMKYIYISFGVILGINLLKLLLIFVYYIIYKEDFKKNIALDPKVIIVESLIFGVLLAISLWILDEYIQSNYFAIIFSMVLMAIIPSYGFILAPLKYIFTKNGYSKNVELERKIKEQGYDYNIITIKGNVINAFATGILPFSKTILVGEELQKKMSEENLLSIIYHEIGHLKLNHLVKLYFLNTIVIMLSFFIYYLRPYFMEGITSDIIEPLSVFLSGIFAGALYLYIPGKLQYKLELEADYFASKQVSAEKYGNALIELDILSDGDVSKGGITHPRLSKRIENIYKK